MRQYGCGIKHVIGGKRNISALVSRSRNIANLYRPIFIDKKNNLIYDDDNSIK